MQDGQRKNEEAADEGISFKPVEDIPTSPGRKGPRDTDCLRALQALHASPTGAIEVFGEPDDPDDAIDRFYKSMVQWKKRHEHSYPELGVRKRGRQLFLCDTGRYQEPESD